MLTKHCKTCDTTKPVAEFYKDIWNSTGYTARCMPCARESTRIYQSSTKGRKMLKHHRARDYVKNREKHLARAAVRTALKSGALTMPVLCSRCYLAKQLQAHHEDYSKPLEVIWLCMSCHKFIHGRLIDLKLLTVVKDELPQT